MFTYIGLGIKRGVPCTLHKILVYLDIDLRPCARMFFMFLRSYIHLCVWGLDANKSYLIDILHCA